MVYATLVTLDGNQDGSEQHQLVTVPSDLAGQQIDLAAFAQFAGQNGITVSDLQVNVIMMFQQPWMPLIEVKVEVIVCISNVQ